MTFSFRIDYHTAHGQVMVLELLAPVARRVDMWSTDGHTWTATLDIDSADFPHVQYRYVAQRGNSDERTEWGRPHTLPAVEISQLKTHNSQLKTPDSQLTTHNSQLPIYLLDRWQDIPPHKPFYSQAFTRSIFRRDESDTPLTLDAGQTIFSLLAPLVRPDETVVLAGSCAVLGNWDIHRAPEMNSTHFPLWQLSVDTKALHAHVEYKAVVVKRADRSVVAWEDGINRTLDTPATGATVAVNGLLFDGGSATPWRGSGVAIPVFSLRSENDCGIGDFYDLKLMIDWAADTGQSFVQVLPVNDTTMTGSWTDSYPYNANSTFALHPMYLRLEALGELPDADRRRYYRERAAELNVLPAVDYEQVNRVKLEYMREVFPLERGRQLGSADFKRFYDANVSWLKPYAVFCALRDIYHTADFSCWGVLSTYDPAEVEKFIASHRDEVDFVYFQQFNLDRQLRHVRDYARSRRIAIKGDIPIGISRTSVDAWVSPRLFNLGCQAGAPPDDFAVLGQNWGFPTYNWDEMRLDGYTWWKARFVKMAEYFDAYRIDHVLGFFRIWEVPYDQIHGLLGTFNPAMPLSAADMARDYGFDIEPEPLTRPYITDTVVRETFGEYADEVRDTFLRLTGNGRYELLPELATQRRVAEYFGRQESSARNDLIRDGLMELIDDVLFIRDGKQPDRFHPRIDGSKTAVYQSLDTARQQAFDRLYEDFYYHRHNEFWYHSAMAKLPTLIDATDMLTCAEDLGMIPACVPQVMKRLEILTLEIQRMPKEFVRFGNPAHYPYLSVCTTSTHDMSGIRGWWEENRDDTEAYYRDVLHGIGEAPYFAEPRICRQIVDAHLQSPSMLCILPLQDWLSVDGRLRRDNPMDERINVPANSRQYWRYRMHLTLEDLLANWTARLDTQRR